MKVDNVVICAAGLGSRLGLDTPKCLVQIGKHKVIYYLLQLFKDIKNVRIVVGFKEDEVMDYVKTIRPDVVFVRNPDYRNTTNAYSLYLGSHDFNTPFLNIDGDMIIEPKSFNNFISKCNPSENLIGVAKAVTEDAVFVEIDDNKKLTRFSREKISNFEWTGIAYLANIKISKEGKYVYQELEPHLPIKTEEVICYEIDTPADLDLAINEIQFLDLN